MSRCRACDASLYKRDTPAHNKFTHQEDDLCPYCRAASKYDEAEHEYVGGSNPRDGLTAPTDSYE